MIKPDKKLVLLLSVLAVTIAGAYWGWQKYRAPLNTAKEVNPPAALRVASDTLRFAADASQLLFLKIQPVAEFPEPLVEALNARISYDDNRTARVFSPLAGRVVKIAAESGQQVKAGDPLLVLDSPDFAMAEADTAKAGADQLRKKEAWERARQLYEIKGIARKDVESAEADWHQAEAEAQRARARMKNLNTSSATAEGQFILRAPVSGIITERQVSAGSEVRPDAASPLFVITDPRHLWVQVDLPERQLDKIQVGRAVAIEVDAYPETSFVGKIAVIGGALDPVTRRIQVRCEVENPALKLKPEMFARVTPIASKQTALPRVPNAALVTQGLYSFIFVEQSPGVLQRRRVTLASQGSQYSYVSSGLRAGERVVSSGALLLNSELAGNE
jgi:cobalt-zinc-cadmium efflux system membrane fusion protein